MIPTPMQQVKSKEALEVFKQHGLVYLAMEERTGKTLTSILVAEAIDAKSVLVVTKAKAMAGWEDTLKRYKVTKKYTCSTYGKLHHLKASDYDCVIVDEAHSYISGFPAPSKTFAQLRTIAYGKPIIYLSATPYAQGPQLLYHQFKISHRSPFKDYATGYAFHATFGIPDPVWIGGVARETYKKVRDEDVLLKCQHLFITGTRAEMGIDVEPEDLLHYIELEDKTKAVYNALLTHKVIELNGRKLDCSHVSKLRASLHMLEGGVIKIDEDYMVLGNREKIDYILEHWGDSEDLVIMYHYKAELLKLEAVFKKALLLQGTSYAEGVDLHKYPHLVIYSQDWSTARHSQRRARQANKNRTEPIKVHFLLCKDAISDEVYETVSVNKQNYIDALFKRNLL